MKKLVTKFLSVFCALIVGFGIFAGNAKTLVVFADSISDNENTNSVEYSRELSLEELLYALCNIFQ